MGAVKSKRKKGVLEEVFSETRRQVESDMISDAWMRTGANDMWNANAADYVRHIQLEVAETEDTPMENLEWALRKKQENCETIYLLFNGWDLINPLLESSCGLRTKHNHVAFHHDPSAYCNLTYEEEPKEMQTALLSHAAKLLSKDKFTPKIKLEFAWLVTLFNLPGIPSGISKLEEKIGDTYVMKWNATGTNFPFQYNWTVDFEVDKSFSKILQFNISQEIIHMPIICGVPAEITGGCCDERVSEIVDDLWNQHAIDRWFESPDEASRQREILTNKWTERCSEVGVPLGTLQMEIAKALHELSKNQPSL